MTRIPELNLGPFWSKMYQSSTINNMNALLPQNNQLDDLTKSFQSLASYSVQNMQNQQQYRKDVVEFTDSVKEARSSAKILATGIAFEKKAVAPSSDGAITGIAKEGAKVEDYDVSVSQVATTQKNESSKLTGGSYGGVSAGFYTFGVQAGASSEKQVFVNIQASDNNKQALTKFATAINNSGAGVVAEVKTKDNTQYLSVTSKDTGAANSFTMRDITGNGVAALQLGNAKEQAVDAKYTVDGTSYQSASNKISLDHGNVTLQLNKATTDTQKITIGKDSNSIVAGAKNLVTSYNRLHDVLNNSDNVTKRGEKALSGMEAIVGGMRANDFAAIGISMNKDTGELKLDETKLSEAISTNPDKVKKLFSGAGGLAKGVENVTKELSSNSVTNYLKSPGRFNVSDYSAQLSGNNWMSQQNFLSQGLFLNMTV